MILDEQREILFCGKKVNMNDWVYGYPCAPIQIVGREPAYAIFTTAKLTRDMGGIFVSPFNGKMCREAYEVYPKTIGQYTGFKDCNGVKIFEHDIVTVCTDITNKFAGVINNSIVSVKILPNDKYKYIVFTDGGWYIKGNNNITSLAWKIKKENAKISVVGNVFDDFELLEEQK